MSENVKHTPGPWHVKRAAVLTDGGYDYAICSADTEVIAEAFARTSATNWPPAEANARLIAAAPEMYEALKALLGHLESWKVIETADGDIAKARAALQKAGRPVAHERNQGRRRFGVSAAADRYRWPRESRL